MPLVKLLKAVKDQSRLASALSLNLKKMPKSLSSSIIFQDFQKLRKRKKTKMVRVSKSSQAVVEGRCQSIQIKSLTFNIQFRQRRVQPIKYSSSTLIQHPLSLILASKYKKECSISLKKLKWQELTKLKLKTTTHSNYLTTTKVTVL